MNIRIRIDANLVIGVAIGAIFAPKVKSAVAKKIESSKEKVLNKVDDIYERIFGKAHKSNEYDVCSEYPHYMRCSRCGR